MGNVLLPSGRCIVDLDFLLPELQHEQFLPWRLPLLLFFPDTLFGSFALFSFILCAFLRSSLNEYRTGEARALSERAPHIVHAQASPARDMDCKLVNVPHFLQLYS